MKSELEVQEGGKLSRTRYNLWNLIDRYVPTATQEAVREMANRYEDQIFDLLATIHDYRERNQALLERTDKMEKEFYSRVAIPVSFGSIEAGSELHLADFTKTYQVTWRPDPYRACIRLADRPINRKEQPYLVDMVMRQFKERITHDLVNKLTAEYGKLYGGMK